MTWLVLACLLPGVMGAAALFIYQYREGQAQLERSTIQTARALVQAVDHHLAQVQTLAQTLVTADSLTKLDFESFHRRAREAVALVGFATNVVLLDPDGQQILNTVTELGHPLNVPPARELARGVFETGKPIISDVFIGPVLKRPIMSVAVPVVIDGKVAYVLAVGILPEHLNAILRAQGLPPDWVATVLDRTGTFFGRTHTPEKFIGQKANPELLRRLSESPEGSLKTTTKEGTPVLSFYSRSPVTGWAVTIGIPRQVLESALQRALSLLGLGIAILFGIGLILAWLMGGRIARSVVSLTGPALALGKGSAEPTPEPPIKEAAEVAAAIDRAASLLRERAAIIQARDTELGEAHRLAKFGTWHWNLKTGEVSASESLREILGREVPPFHEQRGTLLTIDSWEKVNAASQQVAQTGGYDLELQAKHANGALLWIHAQCVAVRDDAGEIIALRGSLQDITERKQFELALREKEEKLQLFIQHAPAALAMFDRDMRYQAVSRRWLEDYRLSGDVLGKSHYDVFPEIPEEWKAAHRRSLAGEVLRGEADRFERTDGSVHWVTWETRPWYDEKGAVGGIGIFAEDVTQLMLAVQALQRNRELLSLITDTAPALISYVDPEYRYRQANQTYQRWFGIPPERVVGQPVRDVIGEAAWEVVRPKLERVMAGEPVSYEHELPYREGGSRWVNGTLTPDLDERGNVRGVVVLLVDITERKHLEAGLVEQRQRLEGIVRSAMDAIISIDAEQRIVLFNTAAEAMFQCSTQAALGTSIERFIPARFRAAHADQVAEFGQTGITSRAMRGPGAVYGLRTNGEEFPIEASISQIEVQGKKLYTVILRDISARMAAEEEIRRMNAELEARVEARTAELREANQELETFAYAVSHDLRAPLRAISGFTKMLSTDYSDRFDDKSRYYLEHILGGAQRMGDLIEGLLQLSRSTRGDFTRKRVDLSVMARRILEEYAVVEPERRVRCEIDDGLAAEGDPRMLEALMRNLLNNAWKYTARKEGALIRFQGDSASNPPRYCVSDNGAGFDMAHADQLFQPFKRLHRQGEFPGIGIGLATVQRIVQRHGGEISARAAPGEGACFCFTLPHGKPTTPPSPPNKSPA